MSGKQSFADESVKGLNAFLSSAHFARLTNTLWKIMSEYQRTKAGATEGVSALEARIEELESRFDILQAKVNALQDHLHQLDRSREPEKPT